MTDYLTRLAQRTLGLLPVAEPLITPSFATAPGRINFPSEMSFSEKVPPVHTEATPGIHEPERLQTFSIPRSKVKKPENKDVSPEPGEQLLNENEERDNSIIPGIKTISEPAHIEIQKNGDEIDKDIEKNIISDRIQKKQDAAYLIKDGYDCLTIGGAGVRHSEQIRMEHETQMHGGNPVSGIKTDKNAGISSAMRNEPSDMNVIDRRIPEKTVHDGFENMQKRERTPVRFEELILETPDQGTHRDISIRSGVLHGNENHINPVITRMGEQKNPIMKDIHAMAQQPPPVKVTIGRVEVRAVASPDVRRPVPARKIPVLSLDEYLKQHKG